MLLTLIEGNRYELNEYDRKGRLESHKELEIGRVVRENEESKLKIITYNYDENSVLKDSVQTTLVCSNSAENMVMNVLAFLGKSSGGRIRLTVTSHEELFPTQLAESKKLKNVHMEIKVEEGVFSFFGAKSRLLLKNRKLTILRPAGSEDTDITGYKLSSKLWIKASVLGLNIKQSVYTVEETVELDRGLVSQEIKQTNGSYFDLRLSTD